MLLRQAACTKPEPMKAFSFFLPNCGLLKTATSPASGRNGRCARGEG